MIIFEDYHNCTVLDRFIYQSIKEQYCKIHTVFKVQKLIHKLFSAPRTSITKLNSRDILWLCQKNTKEFSKGSPFFGVHRFDNLLYVKRSDNCFVQVA